MVYRPLTYLLVILLLAVGPLVALAQRLERTSEKPTREQIEARLRYRTGRVTLRSGLATLDLPADFRYLDAQETDVVLRAWGNPAGHEALGMLVPAGVRVLAPEGWGVSITFSEDGYVKDDDAAKIDYRKLLTTMQQATRDANPERAKAGYATVELVGWPSPRTTTVWPTSCTGRRISSSRTIRRTRSTTASASWAGAASWCSTPYHRWTSSSLSGGTWRR